MRKFLQQYYNGAVKKLLIFSLIITSTTYGLYSQGVVRGTVVSQANEPIIGVTVLVSNSTIGTITDIDGSFKLNASSTDSLIFSSIGFVEQRVLVGNRSTIAITLQEDVTQLNEVVVTALGIEREKKALGYAVQQLEGEELSRVKSGNFVNNLSGKFAGVQVTGANNGLASSSRIVIRGESSLDINGNSPLIVIDGIPVNNEIYGVGGNSTNQADLPTDYGNGAAEINPDDIASVSVLKGAAASALYGSRAAGGVVVITTKSGEGSQGLGVQVSSSLTYSDPLVLPEIQTQYGGGWGLAYYADYGTNFGPSLTDGTQVIQDGSEGYLTGTAEDFIHRYRLEDFFETGVTNSNSITVTSGNKNGHVKLSYGNTNSKGMVPNTDLTRNNYSINTTFSPADKWKLNVSGNYINSKSDNLTTSGYGGQGIMYGLLWNYTNVDFDWLRDYWIEEDRVQRNIFSWADNPFLVANEHINAFQKDRLFGRIASTYEITPALSLMLRVGTDYSNDFRWSRRPMGSVYHPNGMYREQTVDYRETNADFLLTYEKRFGEFSTKVSAGGNQMSQNTGISTIQGDGLAIPGLYTLGNINVTPTLNRGDFERRINSLYGFVNVGYMDFVYLDLTARNDWSSTLPLDNNSYFYPSASLSVVPTELFDIWAPLDYLKARFNVAQVGNDTDPYRLYKTYQFATLPNSLTTPDELPNANLKPELSDSYELGLEAFFFNKRLTVDFTYYKTTSVNQIIPFAVSEASGYQSVVENGGKIENEGVEIMLGAAPIATKDFKWNIMANYTSNRSKVVELLGDLESFIIAEGPNGNTVEARPGERMGDIYGNTYVRSDNGEIVYGENGLPLVGPRDKVGNYNPDFMVGISNSFQYKGIAINATFDIREGGIIYSYTNAIGTESGILTSTLEGREEGIIGDGVVQNEDGTYSENTTLVDAETYYYGGINPRENAEANSFDASYIKLRELSISYSLPKAIIGKAGIQNATISLIGNNLALWTDVPNIDPEAHAINGGTLVPGFEVTQLPSARTYGVKLDLRF